MSDIFLSYSREDLPTARRFAEQLERAGLSVWWDQSLNPGEAFDKVTERALDEAKAVVVLWSKHSVDSRWVRAEATQASSKGNLVPVMIERCKRPIMFELTHTADLSSWNGDAGDRAWQAYVTGVRRFVEKDTPAASMAKLDRVQFPRMQSRATGIAMVAIALLLVGAGVWMLSRGGSDPAPGAGVSATAVSAATTDVTLAVLPFADLSSTQDQEYFSDGLTEELLNQLAQVKGLRVTARSSSFSFKGKNEDVRDIGEKLGVANLLEGSVRKDGTHLRITAQLVNGKDGGQLWSKTYARELSDVFALQEEVAKDVAKALSIKLDVGDLPRVQGGTNNIEAHDKYLQARKLYLQGGIDPYRQAVQLLREAVALDPQFSRAWWLQVYALTESMTGVQDSESDPIRKERAAASDRVLALAPDTWWAQALLANRLMAEGEWAEAEATLAAAAAASADYEAKASQASFLSTVGRARELLALIERAVQLDPLSLSLSIDLQVELDLVGQPAQAQAEYERSKGLTGTHQRANIFALMRILARKEASPAAIKEAFQTLLSSERIVMPLSTALATRFEDPAQVREAIRQAIGDPANQDRVRMSVVALYADRFDETDLALAALRRVVMDFHATSSLWLHLDTGLRADPRFKAMVREVGLADFFRASGKWNDFCKPVGADDFECR